MLVEVNELNAALQRAMAKGLRVDGLPLVSVRAVPVIWNQTLKEEEGLKDYISLEIEYKEEA